ncbi:hypothetical protein EVAR_84467_1 [Eumeta japonica]|uniref:Uncharacterized protein n=1 Tax=Eumeta variegata TaxID=151549 RepID=A0A4C1XCC1_EUMVA|nr:hypothetical protein EVAR_84467_1 [Eumeta japonica]
MSNKTSVEALDRTMRNLRSKAHQWVNVQFCSPVTFVKFYQLRPKSENLSSIGSRNGETAMLFFDTDSVPCRNRHSYLAALSDYCQWSAALPSWGPSISMSRSQPFDGLPSLYCIRA